MNDFDPSQFSGVGRLFPLPNVVLFPAVLIHLHIFEPRYRQMVADALIGDRLIVMALLAPGWETDYEGRPALFPVGCLGRILQEEQLADGRYNLVLQGLARVRIESELDTDVLYRMARVAVIPDSSPPEGSPEATKLLSRLIETCRQRFGDVPQVTEALAELFESNLPLGTLTDLLSYAIGLDIETKQSILSQPDVLQRAVLLMRALSAPRVLTIRKSGSSGPFPPPFSNN